ncbi:tyrosine-type recombinase/integrase [Dyadobacter sp. LHD-138]|uniref:site-specific integrase n=1 Tax=Dyadobacter sp. LHD-138 TaxID=3071413 RepID=UPI0027E16BA1|nr:tyrosine-type recombinase/integrase [Dyadobacter sp. LHD-138]MDQ6482346.1 tyrosine-type recombinase/integrase [Dyadobacter sp. LHD-138]
MSATVFEIKRSISFFLEKRKDKNGALILINVPIRMAVSFAGNRLMLYAGYRIDSVKWDGKKQRAKNNTTHGNGVTHSDINDKLDRCSSGINSYFKSCEVKGVLPTLSDVKEEFSRLVSDRTKRVDTFFTAFDDFVKTVGRENDWGPDTFEKFSTLKNHIIGFNPKLTFEKLNSDSLINYVEYLRKEKGNRNTTIAKNIDFVKWFLKWAANNNHPVSKSALDFKLKLKGTDGSLKKVIFLSIDELKHLNSLGIPESKGYLQRVRDVFVFCCFTGLRYSDVYNLKKSDIKGDSVEFVTQKTSDRLRVELNKYSRAILERYKDVPFEGNKALPVITNQKMNEYLKELGKLAEFNSTETIVYFRGNERIEETYAKHELLSTHCARKTFVTNLIYMGVSDHVIRQWTGHKDSKSFDVYHKMVDEIKEREMSKFDNI